MRYWPLGFLLVVFAVAAFYGPRMAQGAVPAAAQRYQGQLVREAQHVWGIAAPVATFAAQVHQESGWRPTARSSHAEGMAQFTPDTARWISAAFPDTLGAAEPLNPAWALRALVTYDLWLWQRVTAATACDRAAFMLSAYNGGLCWVRRDKALAAARGADPARWWGNVEHHTPRSAAAARENRDYPRRILLRWQPMYAPWGAGIDCSLIARA